MRDLLIHNILTLISYRLQKVLNKRRSMLEITYPEKNVGNLNRQNKNDDRNTEFQVAEMKINGKLKHIFKAMESKFMNAISFPSGKVLR